jgi:hypothetical protein
MQRTEFERTRTQQEAEAAEAKRIRNEHIREEAEANIRQDVINRLKRCLDYLKTGGGFSSLHDFIMSLLDSKDQQLAAQVSQMLGSHGEEILDLICKWRPDIAESWAHSVTNEVYCTRQKQK